MATRAHRHPRRISGFTAAVLIVLSLTVVQIALAHLLITFLILALPFAAAGAIFCVRWRRRRALHAGPGGALLAADPLGMTATEFEHFLAALCRRDKCRRVQVVGGANDHGADVLYVDPHGRRGMIQAKRYRPGKSVGNEHVQIVNGTYRDAHGCEHASIVTTSRFTRSAQNFADHVGIATVDGPRLERWIRGQRSAAPWS